MREVIADGDRHQGVGEGARDKERRGGLLRNRAHQCADPDIDAAEDEPEGDQPGRSDRHELEIAENRNVTSKRGFELAPFRRRQRAVVEHAREQQQHESHHRARNRAAVEKPGAEWPQPQVPISAAAYLDRREPREGAEHRREYLAALEPAVAAEQEHAGQGENGIDTCQRCDGSWHGWIRIDELDPGECQQQNKGGPDAKALRIGQAQAEFASAGDPLLERLDRLEDRAPGIDQHPDVADEG